jgi:hypothetical protein
MALLPVAAAVAFVLCHIARDTSEKVVLNRELIDKYQLKKDDFKKLQYYIDEELTLYRDTNEQDTVEIKIAKFTAGICECADKKDGRLRLKISFEEGTFLYFVPYAYLDMYHLHNWVCILEKTGEFVDFAGNWYKVKGAPRLLIDKHSLENHVKNQKTLAGRKLSD